MRKKAQLLLSTPIEGQITYRDSLARTTAAGTSHGASIIREVRIDCGASASAACKTGGTSLEADAVKEAEARGDELKRSVPEDSMGKGERFDANKRD